MKEATITTTAGAAAAAPARRRPVTTSTAITITTAKPEHDEAVGQIDPEVGGGEFGRADL